MPILYTAERDLNDNRYEGAVLKKIHDSSYRIMSDVWGSADFALVWDEASNGPKHILVNVYDMQGADWKPAQIVPDATDEVYAKYMNWLENREFDGLLQNAQAEAAKVEKGCIAKVVKGKTAQGTIGKVVVVMNATYGMGWRASNELKLAIATSDVKVKKPLHNGKIAEVYQDVVWVWARNVQRVDIAQIDQEALRVEAKKRAEYRYKNV